MQKPKTQESSVDFLSKELDLSKTRSDFMLVLWIHWTESVTVSLWEFQQVIANPSVNKWFLNFIEKEENEFRTLALGYSELERQSKEMDLLYVKCLSKIMSYFPKALLEQAKKREIKAQTTKVAGRRIELLIFNQN